MLSRVADNLYWMSRYLERVEHTARLINENLHQMLDQSTIHGELRWEKLRLSVHMPEREDLRDDAYTITRELTFNPANVASILNAISSARENARQVRELISSEMWEQINRLYLQIKQTTIEDMWYNEPYTFLSNIKEGVQLFQGITDATMSHSEGWYFILLGRFIERASATAHLLDVHFRTSGSPERQNEQSEDFQYLSWVGLLRSCTSFEAYCKVYTAANVEPARILEFLLFNPESPRSIRFAAEMMRTSLQAIAKLTGSHHPRRLERLAGRFCSALEYDQLEDASSDIHAYLSNIQRQCRQIHNAIYQVYIVYPIEVALTERGAAQA